MNVPFIVSLVFNVGFAVYTYIDWKSHKVELAWTVSNQIVFDRSNVHSGLSVLDATGHPIERNVYAEQIDVWNSGGTPIDGQSATSFLRRPLVFQIGPS